MKPLNALTLQARLLWIVLGSSLLIGGVTMVLIFFLAYQNKLHDSEQEVNQLMNAVEYSAAIASYSGNVEVGNDVTRGLIRADSVCEVLLFNGNGLQLAEHKNIDTKNCTEIISHTLYSPFDVKEVIGHLTTRIDSQVIQMRALNYAGQLALMLLGILLLPSIIIWFAVSRYITLPIQFFSNQLHAIIPGTAERITAPARSAIEINQLIDDSNQLLGSVESVLIEERAQRDEIRRLKESFEHLAHHDTLTALPNRALLNERLSQMLLHAKRAQRKGALIYLDLDKFKPVNDTLGHDVGDLLLKAVAQRLLAVVRETDTVARVGGDEFVVVLAAISTPNDAASIANKILSTLAEPFSIGTHRLEIGASLGIAIYPEHGTTEATLTKNADLAMYQAKQNGRNNAQFFSEALVDTHR
jgi:diguanylate cyclase (GGDEF)-like protein